MVVNLTDTLGGKLSHAGFTLMADKTLDILFFKGQFVSRYPWSKYTVNQLKILCKRYLQRGGIS